MKYIKVDLKQKIGGYIAIRAWTDSETADVGFAVIKVDDDLIRMIRTAIKLAKSEECKGLRHVSISFGVMNLYFFNSEKEDILDLIDGFEIIPIEFSKKEDDEYLLPSMVSKVTVDNGGNLAFSACDKDSSDEFFANVRFDDILKRMI